MSEKEGGDYDVFKERTTRRRWQFGAAERDDRCETMRLGEVMI